MDESTQVCCHTYTRRVGIEVVEPEGECKVRVIDDGPGIGCDGCSPSYCELGCARLGSDVSIPSAVPERAPAPGTLSMGALTRF